MGCPESKQKEELPVPLVGSTDAPAKTVDPRLPFENYRQLFQMKNAWKAISRAIDGTSKDTYVRFFSAHPEHQALHSSIAKLDGEAAMLESNAFEEEAAELFNNMDEAMEAIEKDKVDMAISMLKMAGQPYSRMDGLTGQYFKDLEPHFMKAVENTLDNRFNETAEQNFTRYYQFCVQQLAGDVTVATTTVDTDAAADTTAITAEATANDADSNALATNTVNAQTNDADTNDVTVDANSVDTNAVNTDAVDTNAIETDVVDATIIETNAVVANSGVDAIEVDSNVVEGNAAKAAIETSVNETAADNAIDDNAVNTNAVDDNAVDTNAVDDNAVDTTQVTIEEPFVDNLV